MSQNQIQDLNSRVMGDPLQNAGTPSTAVVRGPRQRPDFIFIKPGEGMAVVYLPLQDLRFVAQILKEFKETFSKNSDLLNMFLSFTPESDPLLGNMTIEDMINHPDFPDNATLYLKLSVGL